MPIREENKARYPANWRSISEAIVKRSGGRCECRGECGCNHAEDEVPVPDLPDWQRCAAFNKNAHPVTGSLVVLTVAHLDHQPENCADENLRAMCQRCHNRYDGPMRRAGIAARRNKQRAIGDLFEARA